LCDEAKTKLSQWSANILLLHLLLREQIRPTNTIKIIEDKASAKREAKREARHKREEK
jgi:hypothetical protein